MGLVNPGHLCIPLPNTGCLESRDHGLCTAKLTGSVAALSFALSFTISTGEVLTRLMKVTKWITANLPMTPVTVTTGHGTDEPTASRVEVYGGEAVRIASSYLSSMPGSVGQWVYYSYAMVNRWCSCKGEVLKGEVFE
ncbi:beta-ketoacyl-acyl-carrier-protein synthase II [Anopheles sinensis]|uniref:Beta-ketoacyl-acyl-carrier-protein synthase II n=1 Tax=Anopheles sinensis TaxID=74873 RepID=A0A084VJ86_ANOSI|nr:beta-ketoacyl-acyl-carrier-protein synthase II [Anopheles sinensis]